ncbi:RNA methyltransferase [Candidatus Hepatobacter penaei]|uniref:RNA methyltransferase n=1 Tax=Candidatus Hepatobacter penaei TaxID=1274402 RepID=UPI000AB83920|nr:RNA methyltransferase [Candidatus Hepatobacter penaei]
MKAVFILVRPQLPENVGTALRALWNCGMDELRLVSPKHAWPCEKGLKAAAGARHFPHTVHTFSSLHEAVSDLTYVLATTARHRDMTKPVYSLTELTTTLSPHPKVGIMFGPERTGLTSEDVSWAQGIVTIPLNPAYTSLNLAQCVLLVAHELWRHAHPHTPTPPSSHNQPALATHHDVQGMLAHLESVLDAAGFFYPPEMKEKMSRNIRNAFTRTCYTDQEIRTLRGVVNHFDKILQGKMNPSRSSR